MDTHPSMAAERKIVSVLFVDLVGFTSRSDSADPEDVQATLRPYHARVKQEIERFGGTVEKFVGDAVMAVFGAPVGHEDDAERAVRSALRITQAITELNEEHPGIDLSIRAAVNTGEAVVMLEARPERGEAMVTGDVVNTASRLQQVAPVGGVVVGEITHRATGSAIDFEELSPVTVKGKAEPLLIWRAAGERSRYAAEIERTPTPFVGREDDLAVLQQAHARTLRESSVQLITITGEPGVGKSRLIGEFFRWVDAQQVLVHWRHGRCLPYGEGITFWALGEIVKAQAGILESDGPEEAGRKLSVAVDASIEDVSDRDWVRARLAPLVGVAADVAPTGQEESFTAWRSFLEAVAAGRPLVLVTEDLHWADPAMLQFVEHLVDWATGVPLLVICSARPELYERLPGWGGGKRNSTTISLSPLSTRDTATLVAALLSTAVLPAETQSVLLERCGGNPLYAEEFVRMLMDRGVLEQRGPAVQIAPDVDIPVPESVQALIAARLDTLPPPRKALLHDASVVGKVFWSGAVVSMGGRDEQEVREGLHELARKELVRPVRRSSIEGHEEYAFWHILVRDVAYGQIPRAARADKHRAAAEWIESIAGDRVEDHAEILAHHYEQGVELARAARATDERAGLEERALRFLVMSGNRAFQLDPAKAETYYRRALELLPRGQPARGRILLQAARAEGERGLHAEAERDFEEAISELETGGDLTGAGEAHARLARTAWRRGDTARARALAEEAVRRLEQEPTGPELANAYNEVGALSMLAGLSEQAVTYANRAIDVSDELGLQGPAVRALETRGVSRVELGEVEAGLADLQKALSMGQQLGLGYETATGYGNLAWALLEVEGPRASLGLLREGAEFAHRRGLAFMAMWLKSSQATELFLLGEWDETLQVADETLHWDQSRGVGLLGVIAATDMARVVLYRGDLEEAGTMVDEFLPRAREIGDPQVTVPALGVGALLELARGRASEAVQLVQEFRSITEERPIWRLHELQLAVRILTGCGELEAAEALTRGLSPTTARSRHGYLSAQAILEEARGAPERALPPYRDAVEAWAGYGHVVEEAHALLGMGRCLCAMNRAQEATEPLHRARDLFTTLGAQPLIEETDDWLARVTALSS
jgi:class 3 adenylate cyclase/tetratricopeptide (TPR) repeat protein